MKKIAILGGTFNPIHVGHLTIAQMVREEFGLDKVIFVPCDLPPHKTSKGVITARDRLRMVTLAIKDNPYFEVSDFEIKKGGKSFFIDFHSMVAFLMRAALMRRLLLWLQ